MATMHDEVLQTAKEQLKVMKAKLTKFQKTATKDRQVAADAEAKEHQLQETAKKEAAQLEIASRNETVKAAEKEAMDHEANVRRAEVRLKAAQKAVQDATVEGRKEIEEAHEDVREAQE